MAPDLVGGHDEGLVLDGSGAQQDLPVVTGRGLGERRGDGQHARPVDREAAVELGEAQVVADGQTESQATGERAEDDLVARRLAVGLAVLAAADEHVEHVQLAVGRAVTAVGADVDRGVVAALGVLGGPLGDRAGDEVDLQLARDRARPAQRRAVERLGPGALVLRRAVHRPLLGQDDQGRAIASGGPHETVRGL